MDFVWADIGWLTAEWITTIIAFIAFIVAVLSLWLSSLKGPDIDLCEDKIEFAMNKIQWKDINYIPYRIGFKPARFIFINNGTRSGVIKLEIHFQPSKEFEPFFSNVTCSFKRNGETIGKDDMPHISIRERETCIIEVEIAAEFHDWKENFDFEPVTKDEIYDILCQADDRNHEHFSNFCSTLKPGMHIGKVTIDSRQTTGNIFSTEIRKKSLSPNLRDLSIGSIDQQFIDGFRSCLAKWDDLDHNRILKELEEVLKDLSDILINPLNGSLSRRKEKLLMDLKTDFWNELKNRVQGYKLKEFLIDFISRSSELESKITEFRSNGDRFNEDLRIYQKIKDTLSKQEYEARTQDLNDRSKNLNEQIEGLLTELKSLTDILTACIRSK